MKDGMEADLVAKLRNAWATCSAEVIPQAERSHKFIDTDRRDTCAYRH